MDEILTHYRQELAQTKLELDAARERERLALLIIGGLRESVGLLRATIEAAAAAAAAGNVLEDEAFTGVRGRAQALVQEYGKLTDLMTCQPAIAEKKG